MVLTRRLQRVLRSYSRPQSTLNSPLEGVRVLDLTRILAGPYATMILGDLGAEIIKIENVNGGDDTRRWGPPFLEAKVEGQTRESAYFVGVNRNKKSVCINFKHAEGKHLMHELAKKSDVLVENYVPGKVDELDVGYEKLSKIAPQLIFCSITGFGSEGPYSRRAGYDVIAASLGGLMHITGPKDGGPCKVGVALTDVCTGLYAHGAIMAALINRAKTGKGQKIDCDLLSTQVSTLVNLGSSYLNSGLEAKRHGTEHASIVPYMTFEVKDGYMTVGCGNDPQFKDFCARIGRPDLPVNEKFEINEKRVKNRDELIPILENEMKSKTLDEWNGIFEGCGFPYGAVNSLERVFKDPQVMFNNMERTLEHDTVGTIKNVGPAVKYSGLKNDMRSPPPTLGQHTEQVLTEILGLTKNDVQSLKSHGVVI